MGGSPVKWVKADTSLDQKYNTHMCVQISIWKPMTFFSRFMKKNFTHGLLLS